MQGRGIVAEGGGRRAEGGGRRAEEMASFIGLCTWMAATLGVHLRDH